MSNAADISVSGQMDGTAAHLLFQACVEGGELSADTPAIMAAAQRAKSGDKSAVDELCALFVRVAFISPQAAPAVYNAFTRAWLGSDSIYLESTPTEQAALPHLSVAAPLAPEFWAAFWSIVQGKGNEGPARDDTTARVAALAHHLDEVFYRTAEEIAENHPGCKNASTRPTPRQLTIDELAAQPEGSLGSDIHALIINNNFDLEVLDRSEIGLARMRPALGYLNTRILQMHDIWHLVGGYRTTVLQEVGISAFQLAQFGHNYSAMLLSTAASSSAGVSIEAFQLFMQITAEAWQHGRQTPSFMNIEWEDEWHESVEAIRRRHGITPFASIFPADLVEQLTAA